MPQKNIDQTSFISILILKWFTIDFDKFSYFKTFAQKRIKKYKKLIKLWKFLVFGAPIQIYKSIDI